MEDRPIKPAALAEPRKTPVQTIKAHSSKESTWNFNQSFIYKEIAFPSFQERGTLQL